ncbi:MAG TPA: ornithine cyclodeaminase family protein [Alphaproteobacteria bacterium]|nr:ornithine cyclodeaminase family protein [Alphaproteobacteria bacterium]
MLIINNADVANVLSMGDAIDVLDQAYRQLVTTDAVCKPRTDIMIPTNNPGKVYQWSSVEGGSTSGYFAIRMKSDIIYEQEYNGARTQEKYCIEPGTYCGLIFLTNSQTGEPLAIMNDGLPQLTRVGADGGIGARYLAKQNASVIGMLGSGGMARSHMDAFMHVRPNLKRLQVYSPTKANREKFAAEMAEKHGIEAVACNAPEDVYKGADILAAVTDSAVSVVNGKLLEPGTHIVAPGTGGGIKDRAVLDRVNLYMRFGNATRPWGADATGEDEYYTYAARPDIENGFLRKPKGKRGHGSLFPEDQTISFADVVNKTGRGRISDQQISYSERGNLQGNQFWAIAGRIYELCKEQKMGREIPTDWFLQDIRD